MGGNLREIGIRRFVAACLLVAASAGAQDLSQRHDETALVVHAYTFEHRPAASAVGLVHPLLSGRGTVELQPGGNTLVIRDVRRVLARILPLLHEYDQPAVKVRVRVQIVAAGSQLPAGGAVPDLPRGIIERLQKLLRYRNYTLLAKTSFEIQEGLSAAHQLSDAYRVDFRLGRLLEDRRIGLEGFKVSHRSGDGALKPLIHTNLNLNMEQPLILGLARTEESERALMVIVECSQGTMQLSEQ